MPKLESDSKSELESSSSMGRKSSGVPNQQKQKNMDLTGDCVQLP